MADDLEDNLPPVAHDSSTFIPFFFIETAKTGRAKCRDCKGPIAAGTRKLLYTDKTFYYGDAEKSLCGDCAKRLLTTALSDLSPADPLTEPPKSATIEPYDDSD